MRRDQPLSLPAVWAVVSVCAFVYGFVFGWILHGVLR